jgi:hypothetical protein
MADESPRKFGAGAGQAAIRQGFSEVGQALKAFPDAIQVTEPGQMFSPTQGEIAEANRGSSLQSRLQEGLERAESQPEPDKGMDRE